MEGDEESNDPDALIFSDESLFDNGSGAAVAMDHVAEVAEQEPDALFEEFRDRLGTHGAEFGSLDLLETDDYIQVIQPYRQEEDGRVLIVTATVVIYPDRWYGIAWAITEDQVASDGALLDAIVDSIDLGAPSPFAGDVPSDELLGAEATSGEANVASSHGATDVTIAKPVTSSSNALLQMLQSVPNRVEYRRYLTYGNPAAWHTVTGISRIAEVGELDLLPEKEKDALLFGMIPQTMPPGTLGSEYVISEPQSDYFGFNLFTLDRWLEAGQPPDQINVAEFSFDASSIADALTAVGYESTPLDDSSTLYSIRDDYEIDLDAPLRTGMLGELNRIILGDGQMIIGRATEIVEEAHSAILGIQPSLADDPIVRAVAESLGNPMLEGEMVGMIIIDNPVFDPVAALGLDFSQEAIDELRASLGEASLPLFLLPAFATNRTQDETFLNLAVVFPQGTDIEGATETLAARLTAYTSLRTKQTLEDQWTFVQATSVEANGFPVVLVTMQANDSGNPISWASMIFSRDLAFLWSE